MAADGRRQTVFRAKEIDGSSLPVGLGEDRGARANVRRQAVVDAPYRRRHLIPSELVRENLRQWPELMVLDPGLFQTDCFRIADVRLRRQQGNRKRRKQGASRD